MGFPITGQLAAVTSITSATDLHHVWNTATRFHAFTAGLTADELDVTAQATTGSGMGFIAGLAQGEWSFEALYPKANPRVGNTGLVTFASGYVLSCRNWQLTADFGEEDITPFSASPTARIFRPGDIGKFTGQFTALMHNDTAIASVTAVNTGGAAATFKMTEDGGADPSFTCNIIVTGAAISQVSRANRKVEVVYSFTVDGDLTSVAGSTLAAILPAGVVDTPDWDVNGDGTPDVSAVLTYSTGRTLTFPTFLRGWTIDCQVDQPIRMTGQCRIAGAVVIA